MAYLTDDARTDDVKPLMDAIGQMKGVLTVELGEPINSNDLVSRQRIRVEMVQTLVKTISR